MREGVDHAPRIGVEGSHRADAVPLETPDERQTELNEPETRTEPSPIHAMVLLLAAWLVPGAGHFLLGRKGRAVAFLLIVLAALGIGLVLDGNLYRIVPNRPLTVLATLACMGLGIPYFALRFVLGYQGDVVSAGYEYGTAFILTAGLMNLLVMLDCLDISSGDKS